MLSILIADDQQLMRDSLKNKVYEVLGYTDLVNIDLADNGDVAIKMLKSNKNEYDLLLLDWNMGEVSGEMVLDHIRENEYPDMGTLVLTEDALASDSISAFIQGNISLKFLKKIRKPMKTMDKKLFKSEIQKLIEPVEV